MTGEDAARYDPDVVRDWYAAYGDEAEWDRWQTAPGGAANLAIHREFVRRYVSAGELVLDVGSGPGRFAIQAIEQGARVVVADVSPEMLAANERRVGQADAEHGVVERAEADVTDLSCFDDGRFDVTLCLGGPLSYAYDRAAQALDELVRVTRPRGTVVASVMSTLGAFRVFLPEVVEELRAQGREANEHVLRTGELSAAFNRGHQLKMFRSAELRALVEATGCEVLEMAASNVLTNEHAGALAGLELTAAEHQQLLEWELEIAREPGVLDLGTHILVAARTP